MVKEHGQMMAINYNKKTLLSSIIRPIMNDIAIPLPGYKYGGKYGIDSTVTNYVDKINKILLLNGGITKDKDMKPVLLILDQTPRIKEYLVRDIIFDLLNYSGNHEFARLSKEQNLEIHNAILGVSHENLWNILAKEEDTNKRIQIIKEYSAALPKGAYWTRESFVIYGLENITQYEKELKDLITYSLGKKKYLQNHLVGDLDNPEGLLIDDDGEIISARTKIVGGQIHYIYEYTVLTGKDKNKIYNGYDKRAYNYKGIKGIELPK